MTIPEKFAEMTNDIHVISSSIDVICRRQTPSDLGFYTFPHPQLATRNPVDMFADLPDGLRVLGVSRLHALCLSAH